MIKRLGWRRFLRLFWGTFWRKYFPTAEQLKTDPRSPQRLNNDRSAGNMLLFAILMGIIFATAALLASIFMDGQAKLVFVVACDAMAVFFFSFLIGAMVSLIRGMERCADKFFDEMTRDD